LDLGDNSIGDLGVNYLSTALKELSNLSSLTLDLGDNSIGESEVNYLSTTLVKFNNFSRLIICTLTVSQLEKQALTASQLQQKF